MTDKHVAELALVLAMITNVALVLFFAYRRGEISVYRIFGAMVPGIVMIFGLFAYIVLGFTLTEVFWVSIAIVLGSAGYAVSMMQARKYVREHVPAVKERQKEYWKKRILFEQAKGQNTLILQKSGRLPPNEELFGYGFDEPELRELGLLG